MKGSSIRYNCIKKLRWCVLKDSMLLVFTTQSDEKPEETILLKNMGVCGALEDATFGIFGICSTVLDACVYDSEGKHRKGTCLSYTMTADDEMEKADWIMKLLIKLCLPCNAFFNRDKPRQLK
jgi:hypothetical protein